MDEIADRTVIMAGRLFQIDRFLHNQDITWLSLKYTDGSPWLEFDCWVHLKGRFEFAIWRRTGDIYQVGEDGAVSDDPIKEFPL